MSKIPGIPIVIICHSENIAFLTDIYDGNVDVLSPFGIPRKIV